MQCVFFVERITSMPFNVYISLLGILVYVIEVQRLKTSFYHLKSNGQPNQNCIYIELASAPMRFKINQEPRMEVFLHFFKPSSITSVYRQFSRLPSSFSCISSFSTYLYESPDYSEVLLSLLDQSPANIYCVTSIHAKIILNSLQADQYLSTNLVKVYAKLGYLGLARHVFDQFSQPRVYLCNAMMNAYLKHEKFNESLQLFRVMEFLGLEIDDCTCTFAIKACTALLDYECGMEIVQRVLNSGTGHNRFLGSSMINFLVKFDHVDEARRLFDEMRRKDVVCWNSMMGGYVKACRYAEAVDLFLDMHRYEVRPSNVTMMSLIQAFEGIGNEKLGKCAHGYVLVLGLGDDVMVLTSLINMYGRMGDIGDSCSVFDRIDRKSLVSWNAMISAYVQNGYVREAFEFYQRLIYCGIDFDSGTIVSLLQGCSQTSDISSGKILHAFIIRKGLDLNVILSTSLLNLYSKCGALEWAKYIFAHMKEKNVITWTALLVGLVQNGNAEDALRFFHQMQEEGIQSNSVTLVSLIHSCAHLGSLKKGRSVHAWLLRSGFCLNVVNITALLDMYSKCGKIKYAERIFFNCSITRDVVLWNSMVSGYGLHGHGHQAYNLYCRMINEGVKPNETTFLALLAACSHSGMVTEGTKLLKEMERVHNIRPLDKHYACYVDLLSRAGHLDEAEKFIAEMPSEPQSDVLESLLNGCRFHKNISAAVRTADKLIRLDSRNPGVYVVLSNIYAEVKRWDAVDYVRDLMRSKKLKKTPGYSLIEIGNMVHTFFAGDDSHPDWDEIYQLLKALRLAAEASGYVADTSCVLRDVDEQKKLRLLWGHSERLAIAFGLLRTPAGSEIRITKNLRVCNDCHSVTKLISRIVQREIIVRDANRFHHFVDGKCSCGDFW